MPKYAFCETVHASGTSPWHIRELTSAGKKLGGGADTLALCGRKASWDLISDPPPAAVNMPEHVCSECWEFYRDLEGGDV